MGFSIAPPPSRQSGGDTGATSGTQDKGTSLTYAPLTKAKEGEDENIWLDPFYVFKYIFYILRLQCFDYID